MIDETSSLVDVAFAACTALEAANITAVLSGGAAATYYAPSAYQSRDADFILRFVTEKDAITFALSTISFERDPSGFYRHERTIYTIEFPKGPLMVGSRAVNVWNSVVRGSEVLNLLDVTDCVRDRFMAFYAWGDYGSLGVALSVAKANREIFDCDDFVAWAKQEAEDDRSYDVEKLNTFLRELERI